MENPISPKNNNQNPTTFIQADTHSFKQVVQSLTGAVKTPSRNYPIPPKKLSSPFKLYQRRSSAKNLKMISTLVPHRFGPCVSSPGDLDFQKLELISPVTPLAMDMASDEDRAIAEKGFYLIPSPREGTEQKPKLLLLFPLTSPRWMDAESSASA